VLRELHPALVDYKGLTRYRDTVVEYLAPFDDGSPTSSGTAPE
jgi:dimethylamine monooxygenase subunit A